MAAQTSSWTTAPGLMRLIGGLALGLAGFALALIVLVLTLLQIAPLRQSALAFALAEINTGETHVSIADIEGEWPRRLTLSDLEIADGQGVWLSLREAKLEWSPLALIKGELHILRFDAAGLDVYRTPESGAPEQSAENFALPTLPFAVRLDAAHLSGLSLSRRLVEANEKGLLVKLDLDARAVLNRSRLDLALTAQRIDDVSGRIDLKAFFDNRDQRIDMTIDAVDGANGKPGLAALLGGLKADRLAINAHAEGLDGKVTARARIDGGRTVMLEASADGRWEDELDLDVAAKASGNLVQSALAGIGRPRDLAVASKIRWTDDDTLALTGLTVDAGALALKGDLKLGAVSTAIPHPFTAQGALGGLDRLLGYPGNAAFADLAWRVGATLDLRGGVAHIEEASFAAPPGVATFSGDAKLNGATVKGALRLTLSDIAPLGRIAGQPMRGRVEAELQPFALEANGALAGDFVIRAEAVDMGDPVLTRLFEAFTADGSLLAPKTGGFALPSITVTPLSGAYAFRGNIAVSPADILSGQAHFAARNIAALLPDGLASGALDATADFSGTLDAPGVTLAARLSDGAIVGAPARLVTLDATARRGGSGPVAFRFDGAPGKAAIEAQLTLPGEGGARLDAIAANLFGSKLAGAAALGEDGLITAHLTSGRLDLKPLTPFTGLPLAGGGALELTATPSQGRQSATLTFTAARLDADLPTPLTLDRVTLSAALSDLFGKANVNADFVAASGQAGLIHLDGVTARAQGPLDKLALSATARGARETFTPDPFILAAEATYANAASSLTLSHLDLAVGKAGLALTRPLKIALANGVEARDFALALTAPSGAGALSGDFSLRKSARLHLKAVDVPVDLASLLLPVEAIEGRMNGAADLDTSSNTGAFSFRFERVLLGQGATNERPPFDATLSGKWARGRFDLKAEAQGVSTRPFVLSASLPVNHPADTPWPALAKRGAVSGGLTWRGPLASLAAFVDIGHQRFGGGTHVALSMRGDISAPRISGEATVENGFYENINTGTILKNISARLEGSESQSLAFTLDGTDGGEGKVAAQGRISLASDAVPAISISTSFSNARLVHRADVDATADGQFELTGASFPPGRDAPLTIRGRVTTRALQIRIPESLPSSIAQIKVIEINGTSSKRARIADEAPAIPVALDINVTTGMPARISGRGLSSLWNGELAIAGSVRQPRVSGRLESERGTLDFAGKTFTLSKGLVRFSGAYPVNPEFEVALAYARTDFKAAINLSGSASAPQMTLSSTPTLPQDEILSRILFNKGVGELSAMEALQLARTLAELSGANFGGGGLDVLDRLQESLNLDVLRIDSNATGATTLSAGKYIQKGVYVGVEQGALASDSSVRVEIEVTPQISVNTRIGQNATGDVGVNWKWDY